MLDPVLPLPLLAVYLWASLLASESPSFWVFTVHGVDGTVVLTLQVSRLRSACKTSGTFSPTPLMPTQVSTQTALLHLFYVLYVKNPHTVSIKKYSTYNQKSLKTSGLGQVRKLLTYDFILLLSILYLMKTTGLLRTSYNYPSQWIWAMN